MDNLLQKDKIIAEKYRIIRLLGEGGVGKTYEAENVTTSEKVAIKTVSLRQTKDWKVLELFEREAKTLASLNHPAIPKYIEYFHVDTAEDRYFYLVRELVTGDSLFDLVKEGKRFNESEVKQIAVRVLEIIDYLHQQTPPIIHRDIKPQNLIRSTDGKLFLVDFGSVQEIYRQTLSGGSTFVGTLGYMPPEQLRGQTSFATDLYSLGATLLFLLTKQTPDELPQNRMKINFRSQVKISGTLTSWLERSLEPIAEDRFQSAKEALVTLQTISKTDKTFKYQLPDSRICVETSNSHLILEIPHSGLQGKITKGGTMKLVSIVFWMHCFNYILLLLANHGLLFMLFTGAYKFIFSLWELSLVILILYSCFGITYIIFDSQNFTIIKSLWGMGREVTGKVKDIQKIKIKPVEVFSGQDKYNTFLTNQCGIYAIYLSSENKQNSFGAMIGSDNLNKIKFIISSYLDNIEECR